MDNYFNYFTEIEEHFQRRRGTILLLSTLDWALIETWKDAGIPLEAVLRGIDSAFDHYDKRPSKTRKVNSIAYCSREVLAASEQMKEAAVGAAPEQTRNTGFDAADIAGFLKRNADLIKGAKLPDTALQVAYEAVRSLHDLAAGVDIGRGKLEDLERLLTVMEEKLFAVLLAGTPDEKLVEIRAQADREIAPYRSKMAGPQIEQLHRQYVHKALLERHGIPRLSLFYM
ncbi:MAG: hypothetical protein ACXWCK_30635 [Burkholderiales bacterium]